MRLGVGFERRRRQAERSLACFRGVGCRRWPLVVALFIWFAGSLGNPGSWDLTGIAGAQDVSPPQRSKLPPNRHNPRTLVDLRRRLIELDRLLSLESVGRAEKMLEDLEQHSALERECVPRRIKLYQLQGEHTDAVDLSRKALAERAGNAGLWRGLAESLLHLEQPQQAREALGRFLKASPDVHSSGTVAVEMLRGAGYDAFAVALIDSLRTALDSSRYLGRQRALGLLADDHQTAAAEEISAELQANPYNLSLIRVELLDGPFRPSDHEDFVERLQQLAETNGSRTAQALLVANLALSRGDSDGARALIESRLQRRAEALVVLQNAVALAKELSLLETGPALQATVDYLLVILEQLTTSPALDRSLHHRSADQLAGVCEVALEYDVLGDDKIAAAERFGELLSLVRRVNPNSEHLYSSQIKLANFTRDRLRQPRAAARRLERMLLDLDLPSEGLALVRLTLGECYFAAGDTARGRTVLTRLGRDLKFRQAAGHAHYHLARLDLAEGHFATARDRFAVVALDNPSAPYANDALEMGLAIAEELENPSGGPAVLARYARSVYHGVVARPDSQLVTLEQFVRDGDVGLDLEEKQHLLERARFELAELYLADGRTAEALATWEDLTAKHPAGRFPATALARRGEILRSSGRQTEAQQVLEQLLSQYPDYLFIADVRDQLRNLP